jgi:hypothetical protein
MSCVRYAATGVCVLMFFDLSQESWVLDKC